jgi:hypothetical protein
LAKPAPPAGQLHETLAGALLLPVSLAVKPAVAVPPAGMLLS